MNAPQGGGFHRWAADMDQVWKSLAARMGQLTVDRERALAALRSSYQADAVKVWAKFQADAADVFQTHHQIAATGLERAPSVDQPDLTEPPPGPTGDATGDLAALASWAARNNPAGQQLPPGPGPDPAASKADAPPAGHGPPPADR